MPVSIERLIMQNKANLSSVEIDINILSEDDYGRTPAFQRRKDKANSLGFARKIEALNPEQMQVAEAFAQNKANLPSIQTDINFF